MEMLLNYNELNKNRVYDTLDLCNGIHFNAIGQGYIFDSEDRMAARIVIISGACGTGKSSSSRLLAEKSPYDCAVHIHSDDFYQYIRKGYIAPWLEGSGKQNEVIKNSRGRFHIRLHRRSPINPSKSRLERIKSFNKLWDVWA